MDATGAQPALSNLEASSRPQDNCILWQAHVLESHLAVSMGLIIVSEHRHHALDPNPGRLEGNEHHAVASVPMGIRVSEPHEDDHLASRVTDA